MLHEMAKMPCNILRIDLSNHNESMKNTNQKDEYLLIKQIQGGNKNAFRLLIDQYRRLVSHIVCRMVSNISNREDLCQDIFIKVYQNLNGFRFESKVSTWIAQIAYNTCINHLRKKKIPLFNDCISGNESLDNLSGNDSLPDAYVEQRESVSCLETELNCMNVRYRTIVTLFHLEEMSYTEISQITGLPISTVKSDLFRARKYMKERLISKYKKEELMP